MRNFFLTLFTLLMLSMNVYGSFAPPVPPSNLSGYIVVNGYRVSWLTDEGYNIYATREDNTIFNPSIMDDNGLDRDNQYKLEIPIGIDGITDNSIIKLHLSRNGREFAIFSPLQGKIRIGRSGSINQINIVAGTAPPPVSTNANVIDSNAFSVLSLDASKSYLFGDYVNAVSWKQTDGPIVSLSDVHAIAPSFTAPGNALINKQLKFQLKMTDYFDQSYHDTFIISVSGKTIRTENTGLPYVENFTSTRFKDQTKTSLDWSINQNEAILSKPLIRQHIFSGKTTQGNNIGTLSNNTYIACAADMNGDGNKDLIVGNKEDINYLYLNNGSVTPFNNVIPLPVTGDRFATFAMDTGDVDNDGDIDLVTGNESNTIRLYLNNGTSDPFNGVSGMNLSDLVELTIALKLVDIDGDGHLDVITGNAVEENRLYLNNGTASPFENVQAQLISSHNFLTFAIDSADLDNDGDEDVIVGNSNDINYIYLNNGTSRPFENVSPIAITNDAHNTHDLAVGDIDNNGYVDLVFANFNQTNRVYFNSGDLSNWTGTNLSNDILNTVSIALHDADNDGDLDCLCGNEGINRLYLNNGTTNPFSSTAHIDITDDDQNTNIIIFEDMDNDSDPDIIAGNYAQINRLYINNGFVAGGEDFYSENDRSKALAYGDVNNDGHLDLIVANNGINRIYYNNGTATPFRGATGHAITSDEDPCYSVAIGDVDSDNDLDLVFANISGNNKLYLNNGTANPFEGINALEIGYEKEDTYYVTLVDIDKDGDLDLLSGNDGINRLYLNNGSNRPFYGVTGTPISDDDCETTSLAVGDVDSDGDLDIVAGNEGYYGENRLYLNNGTDNPFLNVEGTNISNDYDNTSQVLLSDIDGDNDLDVIAANEGQTNRIYLNNGTSDPFAEASAIDIYVEKINDTKHIVLADIDNDGDTDLICSNYNTQNRIHKKVRQTAPFFDSGAPMGISDHQSIAMAVFDADMDGDLDVVEANDNRPNTYFANNGNAQSLLVLSQPAPNPDYYIMDGTVVSLEIDAIENGTISEAVLNVIMELSPNTQVDFFLSNTGGDQFFQVQPGKNFVFPTSGADLRWKAQCHTLCPTISPKINEIQITRDCVMVSDIPDQNMSRNSVMEIPFTLTHYVGMPEYFAESSNPTLLPDNQMDLSCTGGDCILRVIPYSNLVGTSYIVVTVNDGCRKVSDSFRLDVTNQPPECHPNPIELTCTNHNPVDIHLNATDPENDTISFEQSSIPQHGYVDGTAPNIRYIVQDSSFVGIDCFSYQVSDGMDDTLVRICIKINNPIACKSGTLTVDEDGRGEGTLVCNKELPRNFYIMTPPEQGNVTIRNQTEGQYMYEPDSDIFGDDIFSFYVKKETENSAPCPVTVNILPVNDAPSFTKGANIVCLSHENHTVRKTGWATNIKPGPSNESDQSISFHLTVSDESYFLRLPHISPDGTITFQPEFNICGTVDVSVSLTDNGGTVRGGIDTSSKQTFQITFEKVFTELTLKTDIQGCQMHLAGKKYPDQNINITVLPPFKERFDINSEVVLSVSSIPEWQFVRYIGPGLPADIDPTQSEIRIPMNKNREISAEFVPIYELNILGQGDGTVRVNAQAYTLDFQDSFVENQNIQIQAIPGTDHIFGGFSGDIENQQSDIQLTINNDMTITATFLEMHELNIDGHGRVEVNGVISDLPYQQKIPQNEEITICGLPKSQFQEWTGDIVSTDNPLTFQITSALYLNLILIPLKMTLNEGWNLISIPLQEFEDHEFTETFPQGSIAYTYNNGTYVLAETISSHEAYWIKNKVAQTINIYGVHCHEYSQILSTDWHLIPSVVGIPTIQLIPEETEFILFEYKDGKYQLTSSLVEGRGYWIKVNQPCTLKVK